MFVAVLIGVLAVAIVVSALTALPRRDDSPVTQQSACENVYIFYGNPQSPYGDFAAALREEIRHELPELGDVTLVETQGGADNLYHLEDSRFAADPRFDEDPEAARCAVAMSKLNVAVDATYGVYQFNPDPARSPEQGPPVDPAQHRIRGLRTVGPAFDDLLQIVVRDPNITRLDQLCGRPLSIGLPLSGSRQVAAVLYRVICDGEELQGDPNRAVHEETLANGFARLYGTIPGSVDAVIWVNAAPTKTVRGEIASGRAHLLTVPPEQMNAVLRGMNEDWRRYYRDRAAGEYVGQDVMQPGTIFAGDGYDTADTQTVGVPNGLVVRDSTDPALVAALARILVDDRDDVALTRSLWPNDSPHSQLADVNSYVGDKLSALFCYVPLHPAAAKVYRGAKVDLPDCGKD